MNKVNGALFLKEMANLMKDRKYSLFFQLSLLTAAIYALVSCSSETIKTAPQEQNPQQEISGSETTKSIYDNEPDTAQYPTENAEISLEDKKAVYQVLPANNNQQRLIGETISSTDLISALCTEIGSKLGSVGIEDCLNQDLKHSGFSVEKRSLAYKDFNPTTDRQPLGKVLVIGGIHGDEFSSISVVFKWMEILQEHHSGLFHWRFIPSANPDGLVQNNSKRQNANGVDLNRNFPTQDWKQNALKYWREETRNNARRFPGRNANSEPETQWLIEQIESFDPDVIISMHAPYHLVDYDGPPTAPDQLGSLYLRQLGVYPGSMGNYIGVDKNMPIVTVELKSAGIMPKTDELNQMWTDLIRWLRIQLDKSSSLGRERSPEEIAG